MQQRTPELHHGHRERVKTRFLREGLENFEEYEILELILFFSVPQRDVNELAHKLLNAFGSLRAVLDAAPEDLQRVNGIGENSATLLHLFKETAVRYLIDQDCKRIPMIAPSAMIDYLSPKFFGKKNEQLLLLSLDAEYYYLNDTVIASGSVESVSFSIRNIIRQALSDNAVFLVIAHNHPAASTTPSQADINRTIELAKAAGAMGMQLFDHLIFGATEPFAFSDDGQYAHIFQTRWNNF